MNKKNLRKILVIVLSFLLTNTLTVFAGTNSTKGVVLPEYQQTKFSESINSNISDEEKEVLLNKYFNGDNASVNFELAKAQLIADGYDIVQDSNQPDAWIVKRELNGTTAYLIVYPFNKSGDCTINIETIEGLFNVYEKLKNDGYTITFEGKENIISENTWNISKGNTTIALQVFDNNGKINISLDNVNSLFTAKQEQEKFETAKVQLEKAGYKITQDPYQSNIWVVGKTFDDGFWVGMTLHNKNDINVFTIKNLFDTYNKLRKNGYHIDFSNLTSSYLYFSHGKNPYGAAQITDGTWTISKNDQTLKLSSVKNNKVAINITDVNTAFSIVKNLNGKILSGYKYSVKFSVTKIVISRTKGSSTQSFKLDLNNYFGTQALSKYNSASKIHSNFTTLKTATVAYDDVLTIIKALRSNIDLNVAKLESNKITSSLIKAIKKTEKTITDLVSTLSTKIKSLKKVLDTDTYNAMYSIVKAVSKRATSLNSKVASLTIKNVNSQKADILNMLSTLRVSVNYVNKSKQYRENVKFEKAKTQLEKDGYTVIQKTKDTWQVEKKIDKTKTYLTINPFNEKKECTLVADNIEGLFNAYEKIKNEGYTIICEGKKNKVATSDWTIKKDNFSITLNPFGDNDTVDIYERLYSLLHQTTEQQITQLKGEGYKVEQDEYNKNSFIVRKTFNRYSNMYLQVYNTEQNHLNMDVDTINGLFNAYQNIKNAGYEVYFLSSENLSENIYSSDYGASSVLLTQDNWLIMKDDSVISVNPIKEDGSIITVKDIEKNGTFGNFEQTVKLLTTNGYNVQQDPFDKKAWIVSKKINSKQVCLTIYFNKEEKSFNLNTQTIEDLFELYQKATDEGYELVFISEATSYNNSLKFYSNLIKNYTDFKEINADKWIFYKPNTSERESYKIYKVLRNDGSVISSEELKKPEITQNFQQKIDKLKAEGYELHLEDYPYSKYSWVISKEIFGKNICMAVYHYDGQDDFDTPTELVEKIFDSYENITESGYTIKTSDFSMNSYYYNLEYGEEEFVKISNDVWFVFDDQKYAFVYPTKYTNSDNISFSEDNLREDIKQLCEDGYKVEPSKNDVNSWIISKQINSKILYLNVIVSPQNGFDLDIETIEGLFNAYEQIINYGGKVFFPNNSLNDFPLNDMKKRIQINLNKWIISTNGYTISLNSSKNIQKFGELFYSLKKQNIDILDMENDELTLKIMFSDEFAEFCEQNKNFNDILKEYNLSISVGRKIYEVMGKKLKDVQEEQFSEILTETLNYYKEVFEIASSIDMLSNNIAVYSLHNSEEWYSGGPRFSPKGLSNILKILNISPVTFDSTELYKISSNSYQESVKEFLNRIINFNKSGYEKALFVFDGHGGTKGFYYNDSEYIDVKELSETLIKAYNNGINLENLTLYFSSCESYYFANNIINNLKSAGIEKFPQLIAEAGKETELGYTARVGISNLEFAIISDLNNKSAEELENISGHLTLELVANCPMYLSNHTVFITNSQIEQLNEQYAQKIGTIVGKNNVNYSRNPYSELQTEQTVETLENIANFFNLKNPEEFKNSTIGTAIGVIMETFNFMQSSDTEDSLSFENQHKNLTPEQESVIQEIRELTKEAEKAVIESPISNSLAGPAAILTEWITHFIYNKAVISKNGANTTTNSLSVGEISSILSEKVNGETKSIFEQISILFKVPVEKMTNVVANFIYNNSVISESKQNTMMSSLKNTVFSFLKNVGTELRNVIEPTVDKFFQFLYDRNIL